MNQLSRYFCRALWVLGLFCVAGPVFSQGLFLSLDQDTRDAQMRAWTESPTLNFFSGYRMTSWENELYLLRPTADAHEPRVFEGAMGLQGLSNHEGVTKVATMGSGIRNEGDRTIDDQSVVFSSLSTSAQGMKIPRGESLSSWGWVKWRPTSWMFAEAESQFGANLNHQQAWVHLQKAFVEWRINSFVLSAGRKPLNWGQSVVGPLLISDNAKNLDSVHLSTLPIRWPSFLSYLGKIKAETFWARMDARRDPPHDQFFGWRVGFMPLDFFEVNGGMIYEFGGNGVDTGTWGDRFLEFLGGRGNKGPGVDDSSNVTNRAFAVDARVRFSVVNRPASLYTEQHIEDCCGTFVAFLKKSVSYVYGLQLLSSPSAAMAHEFVLEYAKTGSSLYFHKTWMTSWSNDGLIMGNPLGADAQGVYFRWRKAWQNQKWETQVFSFWEERHRRHLMDRENFYGFVPWFQVSEKRLAILPRLKWRFLPGQELTTQLAGIRIFNKGDLRDRDTLEWGALIRWGVSF